MAPVSAVHCVSRETMIARMMWNPRNPEGLARSFVTIGNGIVLLGEKGIFDHMDDLDDLISSLTTRFCYFLDLYGSAIPTEVHNQLLADFSCPFNWVYNALGDVI